MIIMSGMQHATVCIRSANRVAGNTNAYSIALPCIARGLYEARFTLLCLQTNPTELRVRWCALNTYSSKQGESTSTVLVFGSSVAGRGSLFVQDPPQFIDISFNDCNTGAATTAMPEHVINVELWRLPEQ
jgi:hypothetical protein